ncbi:MAG: phosphoserine phosphatase RsbU/P [Actinomycetota bacterium]|nr:phosphoserine phosphatase RsbU/P [Actinomycetota bacterium]
MTAVADLIPANEDARIAAVRRFEILDTPPDGVFDRLAAIAARTFDVPIAIVSVVDTDRIWFKSHHGLPDVTEIDRVPGLCASAILSDDPWVVTNAEVDPRTMANPLVAGDFGLRFYAGVPLTTIDGFNLGTICVLDTNPREVTAAEMATLSDLAAIVVDELELRLSARDTVSDEARLRRDAERMADALQASLLPPRPPSIPGMEVASRFIPGERHMQVGGDFYDVWRLSANDWALVVGDACGKGPRAAAVAALARWSVRAASVHHFEPSSVLADLNTVLLSESGDDDQFCTVAFARVELDTCGAWVTVAVSGHPLPMLVRRSGKVEARGVTGLPVGLLAEIDPLDDRVGLGPGDALVFFTDGITEARNALGDQFGEDRLRDVLTANVGRPVDAIIGSVIAAATAFSGAPMGDDAAVLVIRVPDDATLAPQDRLTAATGLAPEDLRLPGYAHDTGPPTRA